MYRKITLSLIFTLFALLSLALDAQNLPYNTVTVSGQTFYKYNVKTGEGLYAVSRIFSVPVDEIIKHNPSAKNSLVNGQMLLIPVQHESEQTQSNESGYTLHTILPKETLFSVSQAHNLKAQDIIDANPGLSVETFQIGKTIRIPSTTTTIEQPTTPTESRQPNIRHTVKRGETLYGISRMYNVTEDAIRNANQGIPQGVKTDMVLMIPAQGTSQPAVANNNSVAPQNSAPVSPQFGFGSPSGRNMIRVGLLLPYLDKSNDNHLRMQEYMEGFLLAIEKIKNENSNIEIELYNFDIGPADDTRKLESLLGTMEMQNLDLLVGGFSDKQVKMMSDFAKERNIKYVVPLPTRSGETINNSNIFQVVAPQSYLHSKSVDVFIRSFGNKNIIIADDPSSNDKRDFIQTLQAAMSRNRIPTQIIIADDNFTKSLLTKMVREKDNVIVPTSGSSRTLRRVLSGLKTIQASNPEYSTILFGYPEWQAYSTDLQQEHLGIAAYITSQFFADSNNAGVMEFNANFRKWYNRQPMGTHPKYGLLGYDTALFFLTAIKNHGNNFDENIDKVRVNTLQFAMHFERMSNWGGFINTGLYLVQYVPMSSTIIKTDKSR